MKLFSLITPFALAATVEEVAVAVKKIGRIQGHIESFINLEGTQELAGDKAEKLAVKNDKIWAYFAKFELANCDGFEIKKNINCERKSKLVKFY